MEGEGRLQTRPIGDRRSDLGRRGSAETRQDERKVIPFAIAPRGSIRAPDGRQWVTTLRDLGSTGLSIIANLPGPGDVVIRRRLLDLLRHEVRRAT